MRTLRNTALALLATLALVAAPAVARADHEPRRGGTIDVHGVHFHFGEGVPYRRVEWPQARSHFSSNPHYRKSVRLERERKQWLRRATHLLSHGKHHRAEHAFRKAHQTEARRQRQLEKLEYDRVAFGRRHRHHRLWVRHR